ncbi:MAG: carbohydrate ABC transporter permease [Chloroflexota bacterium]
MSTTLDTSVSHTTRSQRRVRIQLDRVLTHLVLCGIGIFYIYPFLWMMAGSLKSVGGFFTEGLSIIPDAWRWQNYIDAWTKANFGIYFGNTLFVALWIVLLTNLFSSMAACALARTQLPGKKIFLAIITLTLFLPRGYTIIPIYEIILWLGLNDTLWAVILVDMSGGLIFFTFLYFGFFTTINKEIQEAAIIDGASFPRLYWNIVMPLSTPMIATVTLFNFRDSWNEFFIPLVFTLGRPELRTLTVGMAAFVGENSTDWTLMCAGAVITVFPIVVVFVFLQRYFIEGIAGAVK